VAHWSNPPLSSDLLPPKIFVKISVKISARWRGLDLQEHEERAQKEAFLTGRESVRVPFLHPRKWLPEEFLFLWFLSLELRINPVLISFPSSSQ
jgi:hypothetical protein